MNLRPNPDAPIGSAAHPWASTDMPSLRPGPPFHMTEMIKAEPALAIRILDRLARTGEATRLANTVRSAAGGGQPVLVVGCGTSEHAAQAVAEQLRRALHDAGLPSSPGAGGGPIPIQAFEASLVPGFGGRDAIVIGVSHEGGTWATNRALEAARASGATTAIVTASGHSPGAAIADIVIETVELDTSWCHTVGYVSPIVAGLAVAAELSGSRIDRLSLRRVLAAGLEAPAVEATEALADRLAGADRLIVTASGADRIAGRELALKIEEGAHIPTTFRELETVLHGHLAGMDDRTGLILILTDRDGRPDRVRRAAQVLAAGREIGVRAGAIVAEGAAADLAVDLTPAGRLVVPEAPSLPSGAAALLGSAVPLQLLTERLARARAVNPDPIHRDDPAYRRAAEAAG